MSLHTTLKTYCNTRC